MASRPASFVLGLGLEDQVLDSCGIGSLVHTLSVVIPVSRVIGSDGLLISWSQKAGKCLLFVLVCI